MEDVLGESVPMSFWSAEGQSRKRRDFDSERKILGRNTATDLMRRTNNSFSSLDLNESQEQ